jgi:hypothetical protein
MNEAKKAMIEEWAGKFMEAKFALENMGAEVEDWIVSPSGNLLAVILKMKDGEMIKVDF